MKYLFKIKIGIFHLFPVFLFIIMASCNQDNNDKKNDKDTVIQSNKTNISGIDKSNTKQNDDIQVFNSKSIIFYTLSPGEYNEFIRENGDYSKYEFDGLINTFKRMESHVRKIVQNKNIATVFTTKIEFQFTTKQGQIFTFNRLKENKFMGQIFFDGIRAPRFEDGMLNAADLKEIIQEYFHVSQIQDIVDDSLKSDTKEGYEKIIDDNL